jgi:hypothetical protein
VKNTKQQTVIPIPDVCKESYYEIDFYIVIEFIAAIVPSAVLSPQQYVTPVPPPTANWKL